MPLFFGDRLSELKHLHHGAARKDLNDGSGDRPVAVSEQLNNRGSADIIRRERAGKRRRFRSLVQGKAMKSQGEIEAAICEGLRRFEQEYMGRGPKDIHAHLIGDLLVVRLHGVLTAAEQHLVKSLPGEKGRDLLKQVRTHLIETARPLMETMVHEVTGVKVLSLHHDISTVSGEEIVVFTLAGAPAFRETRKK
jgi:uncharacterized protein YbcI